MIVDGTEFAVELGEPYHPLVESDVVSFVCFISDAGGLAPDVAVVLALSQNTNSSVASAISWSLGGGEYKVMLSTSSRKPLVRRRCSGVCGWTVNECSDIAGDERGAGLDAAERGVADPKLPGREPPGRYWYII